MIAEHPSGAAEADLRRGSGFRCATATQSTPSVLLPCTHVLRGCASHHDICSHIASSPVWFILQAPYPLHVTEWSAEHKLACMCDGLPDPRGE